jgi:dienelactone hydrolase
LWNETYPKGQVIRVENVDVYTVGNNTNSTNDLSIIVIYDVFGFNISETRVFCDRLSAQYKVQVSMPDFFRGRTASPHMSNLTTFLSQIGNWSQVSSDLSNVASWLRNTSPSRRIALIGFCWGGLQVVRACSNLSTLFFTGLSIHGAWLTDDEVRQLQQPILFIAAGDDPPLKPNISSVIEQWTSPRVANQCQYKTYSNMKHGFVSAGANYSDLENVAAIDDVHATVKHFLDQISRNSASIIHCSIHFVFILLLLFHLNIKS